VENFGTVFDDRISKPDSGNKFVWEDFRVVERVKVERT
jgi:hypothetical protein